MIPCLYRETEEQFNTNGIGKLCDALSCFVTEKRNGSYELKLGYPSDGIHAEDLVEGNIILAKPAERTTTQPFRIYKITTPLFALFRCWFSGGNGGHFFPCNHGLPVLFLDGH